MKVKAMERYATERVGDGKTPNLYFVSQEGMGVVLISRFFDAAYTFWKTLPKLKTTSLEDRKFGVICSTERRSKGLYAYETVDNSALFRKHYPYAP